MSDWYVSSVAYMAVAQFAGSHLYSIGDIVRQRGNNAIQSISPASNLTSVTTTATAILTGHGFISGQSVNISGATQANYNKQTTITVVDANTFTYAITATTSPATGSPVVTDFVVSQRSFRCTTGGTSAATEPTWNLNKGNTTTSSGATFTEVTGNSTYNWTAPSYTIAIFNTSWAANGDRVLTSSDHAESYGSSTATTTNLSNISYISVNRAGSVPPVIADVVSGAQFISTGPSPMSISTANNGYFQGFTFSCGTGSGAANLTCNGSTYFKNCSFILGTTGASTISPITSTTLVVWDNCTVTLGATGQSLNASTNGGVFIWKNSPSALLGSVPTTFITNTNAGCTYTFQGVDISGIGSNNLMAASIGATFRLSMFDCKISSGLVFPTLNTTSDCPTIEVINCDSGATGYRNELYQYLMTQTTETTITRSGGASDAVQAVSWKCVTLANSPIFGVALNPVYIWNTAIGSPRIATVEIISSTTLNVNDIWMELKYLGSAASPVSSVVSTLATLLTATALPTSSATWNSSPSTPVKQYLQVTFTPLTIGFVSATIKFAKASTTLYVDPVITIQ